MSDTTYRLLEKGEIVQHGDECDVCNDGWRDSPKWVPAEKIGCKAPDPSYPSHRKYRRPLPMSDFVKWRDKQKFLSIIQAEAAELAWNHQQATITELTAELGNFNTFSACKMHSNHASLRCAICDENKLIELQAKVEELANRLSSIYEYYPELRIASRAALKQERSDE